MSGIIIIPRARWNTRYYTTNVTRIEFLNHSLLFFLFIFCFTVVGGGLLRLLSRADPHLTRCISHTQFFPAWYDQLYVYNFLIPTRVQNWRNQANNYKRKITYFWFYDSIGKFISWPLYDQMPEGTPSSQHKNIHVQFTFCKCVQWKWNRKFSGDHIANLNRDQWQMYNQFNSIPLWLIRTFPIWERRSDRGRISQPATVGRIGRQIALTDR